MKFVQGFYRLRILSTRLENLVPLFDSSVVISTRLERGDKPEKGGGGWCRNGGWHFFITLQFNHIYYVCGESKDSLYYFSDLQYFEFAIQDSHPCLCCTKTWSQLQLCRWYFLQCLMHMTVSIVIMQVTFLYSYIGDSFKEQFHIPF